MPQERMPLVDRFGRRHNYLRISITDQCNFRCGYCMPREDMEWMPRTDILSFDEIEHLAAVFASLGVDKIRLTGGEPTTRKGLPELAAGLRRIAGLRHLHLTTNGDAMRSLAVPLQAAGVNGINISLDSLSPDRFAKITRRDRLERVLDGITASLKAGFETVKINVVVMAGVNDDELCGFVHHFRNHDVEVRFIEFMPFLSNGWEKAKMMPYREMRRRLEAEFRMTPIATVKSAVAKEFAIEGSRARVGFITSMTDDFCGGCNRIRLTADGCVKVCLFAKTGPSLRDPLRAGATDDELVQIIRTALDQKWAGHPPMTQLVAANDRPMITIGG